MNRAPPSARLTASIRPPCRFDDPGRDRQAETGPATRRALGSVEALEEMGQVLGSDPGSVILDDEGRAGAVGPDLDADPSARRAVPDRVVDQDHDQLAQPGWVAGDDRGLRIDLDPDAAIRGRLAQGGGAVGGHVAEVERHALQLDRARIGPGEEQEVLDDRGHVGHFVVDVLERRADRLDALRAVAQEVVDAAPDDRQRRPQLVACVGREFALAPQRGPLVGQRFADRNQGAARIHGPEADGDEDDHETSDQQDGEHRLERPLLGGPVLDDLDGEDRAIELDGLGQDPDRGTAQRRRSDVAAGDRRSLHARLVRQSGWGLADPRSRDHRTPWSDDEGIRPGRTATAEREAVAGLVLGIRSDAADQAHPGIQLRGPGAGQRPGHRRVEHGAEDHQDEQGRPAAPEDEVSPDVADQSPVGGLGGRFGRGGGRRWQDPVRHRPDDSPRRARSR